MAQYADTRVNVVSLGAGYDTTYFWLKKANPDIDSKVDYIEIDFAQVVKRKATLIKEKEELVGLVTPHETPNCANLAANDIESDGYKLFESDVRDGAIITEKL